MLKLLEQTNSAAVFSQPPSGGCVLKHTLAAKAGSNDAQPPSGGCVLKPTPSNNEFMTVKPAAFGRLCVETTDCYVLARTKTASRLRAAVC